MALKPARDAAVSTDAYEFTVIQVTPKVTDPATGKQKTTSEGMPLWTVDCLRTGLDGAAVVSVTVPSPTKTDCRRASHFRRAAGRPVVAAGS